MALLTVPQAAKRLGVSDRTVTYWIKDKQRLKATEAKHGHHKLLIEESEIDRLLAEMAQEQPEQEEQVTPGPGPAASEDITKRLERVEHWLSDLQRWHSELESRLEALEQGVSIRAGTDGEASPLPLQRATEPPRKGRPPGTGIPAEPPKEISSGSLLLKDFAELHGVPRETLEYHVKKGIAGEYVETLVVPNLKRPGQVKRWLTPDQQSEVIQFWKRHDVPFTPSFEQDQDGEA